MAIGGFYLHQNLSDDNVDLSSLAANLKRETIQQHQMGIVDAQKARLQEIINSQKDGQQVLESTFNKLQQAAAQTTAALSSISFAGTLTRGGKVKISPVELQNKLSKAASTLEDYGKFTNLFLQQVSGQSMFTPAEVSRLSKIQANAKKAIEMLRSNTPINDYKELLGYVTGVASDALGSLSEYGQASVLQQLGLKVKLTGSQAGESYRTKTSDFQIMLNGVDESQFIGVSVKRSSDVNSRSVYAKVKTSTLRSLVEASQINIDHYSLYYAIANHGRTYFKFDESRGRGRSIPTGSWQYNDFNQLIKDMHNAFLLTSLAGDLTSSDFATYMVINDRVYSVLDMVTSYFHNENKVSISSNIKSAQKEIVQEHFEKVQKSIGEDNYRAAGVERSASVIKAISQMTIVINARINLSLGGQNLTF